MEHLIRPLTKYYTTIQCSGDAFIYQVLLKCYGSEDVAWKNKDLVSLLILLCDLNVAARVMRR